MRNYLIVSTFILVLAITSCGPKQYYEQTESGLEYYFFKKNKEAKKGQIGDIYNLNITATTRKDSLLFSKSSAMFQRSEPIYEGDFHEGLGMLHEGDSAAFILSVDSFFGLHGLSIPHGLEHDSMFKLLIGVEAINNPFEHTIYMSEKELVLMEDYAERRGWDAVKDSTGIMYQITTPNTEGDLISVGDSVDLSYMYATLKDRVIERTREGDPWRFQVGGTQTRVAGLNRLLVLMRDGERARALIPFTEAFGEDGFGMMIPPYTTLVVEVEAQKVK